MTKPVFDHFIIGLTGGIGSGKSEVARLFRDKGITVVDADQGARAVVQPGCPALAAIATHFGPSSLLANGELDRAALRKIIFDDPAQKRWLENLLHPLIRQWIIEQLQQAQSRYAILESPLLLETDQHRLVDRVLIVDCPQALQHQRAMARDNNTEAQINAIMAAQLPRQARLDRADDVIDNSNGLEMLAPQVATLHNTYMVMTRTKQKQHHP